MAWPRLNAGGWGCSQWWYARISVCLVHHAALMADHRCKAASEAVARTPDPFAFVGRPGLPCPGRLRRDARHPPRLKNNVNSSLMGDFFF